MTTRVIHCGNCGLTGHNRRCCKVDVRGRRKVKRKPNIILKKKRVIKCGSCGETGHNKKTCGVLKKKIRGNWSFIKSIDTAAAAVAKSEKEVPEPVPCSICFDDCCGKTCTLGCGHEFHTQCIFTWFKKNNNCPICRAVVPEMKKAVLDRRPFMPSRGLIDAMIHMVDDLGQWSANMPRQRYAQAVFFMLEQTLLPMTTAEYEEMIAMDGEMRYESDV